MTTSDSQTQADYLKSVADAILDNTDVTLDQVVYAAGVGVSLAAAQTTSPEDVMARLRIAVLVLGGASPFDVTREALNYAQHHGSTGTKPAGDPLSGILRNTPPPPPVAPTRGDAADDQTAAQPRATANRPRRAGRS